MAEGGVANLVGSSWTGLVAPAGTPAEIVNKVRAHAIEALKSPEIVEKIGKLGGEVKLLSVEEFAAHIASEHQRVGALIRAAGVKAE
jgi:tripartite-type tricarboxylate transporter receptor subunit TctC